ncbi:hypothetical protein NDU88_004610 [Pleurodeles waltl]|uniref:Uncharacterized protein n=1 Tax=Pleurodeles waltl TaxID=8319 RepID=A0AAV7L782_PLEWA|nr:hypothetical protein NDU88_004610 [Pleurodeles waltl]
MPDQLSAIREVRPVIYEAFSWTRCVLRRRERVLSRAMSAACANRAPEASRSGSVFDPGRCCLFPAQPQHPPGPPSSGTRSVPTQRPLCEACDIISAPRIAHNVLLS